MRIQLKLTKKELTDLFNKLTFEIAINDLFSLYLSREYLEKKDMKEALIASIIAEEKENRAKQLAKNNAVAPSDASNQHISRETLLNDYFRTLDALFTNFDKYINDACAEAHELVNTTMKHAPATTRAKAHNVVAQVYNFAHLANTMHQMQKQTTTAPKFESIHERMRTHVAQFTNELNLHMRTTPAPQKTAEYEMEKFNRQFSLAFALGYGSAMQQEKVFEEEVVHFMDLYARLKEEVNPKLTTKLLNAFQPNAQRSAMTNLFQFFKQYPQPQNTNSSRIEELRDVKPQ